MVQYLKIINWPTLKFYFFYVSLVSVVHLLQILKISYESHKIFNSQLLAGPLPIHIPDFILYSFEFIVEQWVSDLLKWEIFTKILFGKKNCVVITINLFSLSFPLEIILILQSVVKPILLTFPIQLLKNIKMFRNVCFPNHIHIVQKLMG